VGREVVGLREDGSTFPRELAVSEIKLPNSARRMFAGIVHDITERVRTEEILRERARLSDLTAEVGHVLAEGGDLSIILPQCAASLVKHLDAAFARIWLFNEAENVLELVASAGMYTHLDGPHSRVPVGQFKIGLIAQERKPHLTNSVLGDPRVGDQEWARREGMVAFAGHPLIFGGRFIGVLAVFARHPFSEVEFEKMAVLADAIATGIDRCQTEEQLVRARNSADSANRFKSEFLASMSHELRTPLNGVLGMNELLLITPLTDKQREFVDASNTSGRALLCLINDVLDISKIETGKLELDIHECDLEALAYDALTIFSHQAKQNGVSLSCRLDPETCVTALCDDNRLRQVLVNLLGNALKFTAAGSVILESKCVQRDEQRIVVRLAVTDTGLGIPDDKLNHVFSPFSQVDSSTSRHYGGTGLGLSITTRLVELMGGTIGVRSRLGVGSTFWVEIPFELVQAEAKTVQQKQLLNGIKVLAVDGVDKERRQIADCLESWGCPFQQVGMLQEAIEVVAQAEAAGEPFALVLADCRLAIGEEFVHLQNLARRPDLPVIGLGLSENNEMAEHLRQLGLRQLLRDPVRPSALFDALTSVLAVASQTAFPNQKPDAHHHDEQASTFTGHILVAEDNHINQMFVRELLKHFGCTCDIAHNGDETLTALQQKRYDLALMDCQMPEMDGFTAAREIHRREAAGQLTGRLRIIALTANALKGDRERCLEAGMDDYLCKPLQAAQLQTMLAKYLRPKTGEQPNPDRPR
jgi:Amt family ammonium transporter